MIQDAFQKFRFVQESPEKTRFAENSGQKTGGRKAVPRNRTSADNISDSGAPEEMEVEQRRFVGLTVSGKKGILSVSAGLCGRRFIL
jgi:hypothetical protein